MFGGRMMERARQIGLIPVELKVLYHDLARLLQRSYSATSADAANCYDRVHHIIMALLLWALGMPIGPIAAMLLTIAFMRYYIRTGFGESTTFMGGEKATAKMHGLNQGNRATSHCWSILSALLVLIQRKRGHIATITTPISRIISTVMGLLYVDDTDLFIFDAAIEMPHELWLRSQAALSSWGTLLIGTGGAAKPDKSWSYSCISIGMTLDNGVTSISQIMGIISRFPRRMDWKR